MHRSRRPLAVALSSLFALACGGGGDGDDGGTETDFGTGSATTPVTHGSNSSVTVTATNTFTNTSDPSGDPTSDPSSVTDPTTGTDEGSGMTTASPESSDSAATMASTTGDDAESSTGSDTGGPGGSCCEAQKDGGCDNAAIEACVCADDDFCCETAWDDFCTVQVVVLGCAECPGIGGDGDCCAAHGNPGCDDDEVEACVCTMDFVCCLEPWDELCVDAAVDCGVACN